MVARTDVSVPERITGKDSLLRRALVGNALFSAVAGTVMILGTSRISDFTGLTPGWVPAAIGVGVLIWAVAVGWIARREEIQPWKAWLVIGGDLAWVVASYAVIVAGKPELTTAGVWTVGILAEVVALFAIVQYLGLRRLQG
ncbi:hypothetical protein BH23CHL2_BH23CHL2_09030 [soil metagenome]